MADLWSCRAESFCSPMLSTITARHGHSSRMRELRPLIQVEEAFPDPFQSSPQNLMPLNSACSGKPMHAQTTTNTRVMEGPYNGPKGSPSPGLVQASSPSASQTFISTVQTKVAPSSTRPHFFPKPPLYASRRSSSRSSSQTHTP